MPFLAHRFVVLGIAGVIPDLGEGRFRKAQDPLAQLIVGERFPFHRPAGSRRQASQEDAEGANGAIRED
jgi:hypothetical protein